MLHRLAPSPIRILVLRGRAIVALLSLWTVSSGVAQTGGGSPDGQAALGRHTRGRAFYFTRAVYTDVERRGRFGWWSVDYPKADRQFLMGLTRLTGIDAHHSENPIRLDDPELRRYPLVYAVEVGHMALTEAERTGLRNYLIGRRNPAGG